MCVKERGKTVCIQDSRGAAFQGIRLTSTVHAASNATRLTPTEARYRSLSALSGRHHQGKKHNHADEADICVETIAFRAQVPQDVRGEANMHVDNTHG